MFMLFFFFIVPPHKAHIPHNIGYIIKGIWQWLFGGVPRCGVSSRFWPSYILSSHIQTQTHTLTIALPLSIVEWMEKRQTQVEKFVIQMCRAGFLDPASPLPCGLLFPSNPLPLHDLFPSDYLPLFLSFFSCSLLQYCPLCGCFD